MPTLTDTILTIRCPYCMAGIEFSPMIAYKDGRFVCRDCAHTVCPGITGYKCTCRPCRGRTKVGCAASPRAAGESRVDGGAQCDLWLAGSPFGFCNGKFVVC